MYGNLSQSKDVRDVIMQNRGTVHEGRQLTHRLHPALSDPVYFLRSLSDSVPVCGDAARLKEHRDVFLGLRGPDELGPGPSKPGQSLTRGDCSQVRTNLSLG